MSWDQDPWHFEIRAGIGWRITWWCFLVAAATLALLGYAIGDL